MAGFPEAEGDSKSPLDQAGQLARLVDSLGLDSSSPLYAKAGRIVEGMIEIWHRNGEHFTRPDAEAIQALVMAELTPQDFKQIAILSFAKWATPARLAGPGMPHLNRLNQCLADKAASLVSAHALATPVSILDLGAGLLSTTEVVVRTLASVGVDSHITALDSNPVLVKTALERRAGLLSEHPHLLLDMYLGDMLDYVRIVRDASYDFVTISFAIHHLHPTEQSTLVREALRVLKSPGALLVADPQEGKSDFNLKVLVYEEPEAIFVAFTSPESMQGMMVRAGFDPVDVLMRDDTGYEGYAVCGQKLGDPAV